jgi:hypothetical protein
MFRYLTFIYVSLLPIGRVSARTQGKSLMRHWIATIGLAVAGPAFAGQADVCYSPAVTGGQTDRLTSSTVLDCPTAGRHTLPQLAQAGWSIASVQPAVVDYSVDAATQTPHSATSWMVVIQREGR